MARAVEMKKSAQHADRCQIHQASNNCLCYSGLSFDASIRPKIKLDLHADTCIICDNYLVIHRPFNVFSYDPKDGHKCVRTVNAEVCYENSHSGKDAF